MCLKPHNEWFILIALKLFMLICFEKFGVLKMKQRLRDYLLRFLSGKPILFLIYQLVYEQKLKGLRKDKIQSVYKEFTKKDNSNTIAVDLGSGINPANEFRAETILGLDVFEDKQNGVSKCLRILESFES